MNSDEEVELRPAFAWDCPECGREYFARAIVAEFSEEQMTELREDHGVEPWETGDFLVKPDTVTCTHCQVEFATRDFAAEQDP